VNQNESQVRDTSIKSHLATDSLRSVFVENGDQDRNHGNNDDEGQDEPDHQLSGTASPEPLSQCPLPLSGPSRTEWVSLKPGIGTGPHDGWFAVAGLDRGPDRPSPASWDATLSSIADRLLPRPDRSSTMMGRWDLTAASPANRGAEWPRCRNMRNPTGQKGLTAAHSGGQVMGRMVTTRTSRAGRGPICSDCWESGPRVSRRRYCHFRDAVYPSIP